MPDPTRILRPLLLGAALLLTSLASGPAAHAQDISAPWVDYSPTNATFTTPQVPVTLRFRDDATLAMGSAVVVLGTDTITHLFAFGTPAVIPSGPGAGLMQSVATATLTLEPGENVLSASICDQSANCSDPWSVTYTYYGGQQGVRVTPDGGQVQVASGATGSQAFSVKNTWSGPLTFTLRASCSDATGAAVAGCSAPSSVTIDGGDSAAVSVSFPGGSTAGREMVVRLSAASGPTVADAGWVDATSTGSGSAKEAPLVAPVDLNHGPTTERSECVTVAVAPGAAYECGDLRVAHALPAHRTHGRTWAPVLLYNSQHAHPLPTVYADVTVPSNAASPDSVGVSVALVNGTVHGARFPGSDFTPGVPRRVAVQWDGLSLPTGEYRYNLQVTSYYSRGLTKPAAAIADTLVIVNRHQSGFGAGWWVSGWERLLCIDCPTGGSRMLWIGGDGSTRIYEPLVTGQSWIARHPDGPPDTLRLSGSVYTRTLPGGGRIEFDDIGVHVRTVNRLGQTTTFAHTAGRLDTIRVPAPAPAGPRRWVLLYSGGHATHIQTLGAGPNRQVELGYAGGNLPLTAIVDADGTATHFHYPTTGGYGSRMVGMVTRDSARYTFGWDAAKKLSSSRLVWSGTTEGPDDILQQFQAAESRGVGTSVAASQAYTRLDGPREDVADHTYLWLTDRGAPRRIRNPEGVETVLARTNASFPALVTQVRSTNVRGDSLLLQSTAVYNDTTALLLRAISHNPRGDLRNDTTVYAWDARWRRPVTIRQRSQGDLVGITTITYDSVTGNLRSQLVGTASRRVWYDYHTSGAATGQLAAIRYPHPSTGAAGGGGVDSLYYDGLGNLVSTRSPLGFRTLTVRDELGRDSITYTPIDSVRALHVDSVRAYGAWSRVTYDVMDRPTHTVSHGPARTQPLGPDGWGPKTTPVEEVAVTTTYDRMGRVLTVTTSGSPIPATTAFEYEYDRAGRKTMESSGGVDQYFAHDKAGNVVTWTTPRGKQIHSRYDVMGRQVQRAVPSAGDARECVYSERTDLCYWFPQRPNGPGNSFVIPADTSFFRYDLLGRMVYAENNDAIVQRSYYPGGAIQTDTLRMREYAGARFDEHTYGLRYEYDRMNRLSRLWHPSNLMSGAAAADSFAYDSITGALRHARSRTGVPFDLHEDLMGRPRSLHKPGISQTLVDSTVYDIGSRVVKRMTGTSSLPADLDYYELRYDARGKLLQVNLPNAPASVHTNWYSGLGNLVATEWDNVAGNGVQREEMVMDALGNIRQKRTPLSPENIYPHDYHFAYTIEDLTGRVLGISRSDTLPIPWTDHLVFAFDTATRQYDASGNMWLSRQSLMVGENIRDVQLRNYYGADERLHATQRVDNSAAGTDGVWEEYRYDPLGRRILVRAVREDLCAGGGGLGTGQKLCQSTLTRYVWSGDQILWEMRVPGADGEDLERTAWSAGANATRFGRVSYLHAGGIDRPLAITKDGVGTVVPHQNWRGMFAWGTWGAGTYKGYRSDCLTSNQTNCMNLAWPGWQTSAWHKDGNPGEDEYWMGSLVDGMRDASGQIYMRNRYYDPATGQFTQQDPIGLAGGLNAYGFAGGDPVSYSDPYGLCAKNSDGTEDAICRALINLLRTVAREVQPSLARGVTNHFSEAADRYERTSRRVEFVDPNDRRLDPTGRNQRGNGETLVAGRTTDSSYLLNRTLGAGDLVAVATHEAVVHEHESFAYTGDLTAKVTNKQIWNQLPERMKQTAPFWRKETGSTEEELIDVWP